MDFMSLISINGVQELLTMILTIIVLPLIYKGFAFLLQKTQNYYIEQVIELVRDCVVNANQTVVDELKKGGEFTEERQIEVFNAVFDKIVLLTSSKAKAVIAKVFGDFETYIKNKIDVIVKDEKTS